jgi:hypothetical protein
MGTADGRVGLAQVQFTPRYQGQKLADLDVAVAERGVATVDRSGRARVRQVGYAESDSGRKVVAALVGDDEIALWDERGKARERRWPRCARRRARRVTCLAWAARTAWWPAPSRENVYHWSLADAPRAHERIARRPLAHHRPGFPAGRRHTSWRARGTVSSAPGSRAGWANEDAESRMVRAHDFPAQGSAVTAMGASTRDKSFVTVGEDGSVVLRYLTSERTLLTLSGGKGVASAHDHAEG